ncbi:MAG: hypothetical protein CVV27_05385 [Candidatus Melainabacteria bacterium HGW-Melainabacteria-1]|nr:MAG: hypothetical protein CVV27_05385 [Candidatus Melainabacteria bacterium HGW-Melainabacteria-1]
MACKSYLARGQQLSWRHAALALLLVMVACSPVPLNPAGQNLPAEQPAARSQANGPYHGLVNLKIDTGLASGKPGKVVDLSTLEARDFSIQANQYSAPLFEETLKAKGHPTEVTRTFHVSDTSQRYTLQVDRGTPATGIEVNLNGTTWIRPQSFGGAKRQAQVTTLLLQASNAIRIRTWGHGSVTVRVVSGGSAGTVFRRRGKQDDRILTQEERLRRNDVNIFDPANPDSLGGLLPYEGDAVLEIGGGEIPIGVSKADGTTAKILVGELKLLIKEPVEANVQALQERFPLELIRLENLFDDPFATFKVDLSAVSLSGLAADWQTLNQRSDRPPIQSAEFSSVNTAKTIAAAVALQVHAQDLMRSASLVDLGEKHQAAPSSIITQEQNTSLSFDPPSPPIPFSPPAVPVKSNQLWWLEADKAPKAWHYSMGRGAVVAVLDSEFGQLKLDSSTGNPKANRDFKDRVLYAGPGKEYLKSLGCGASNDPDCLDYNLKRSGHGLQVMDILAAGDNNSSGIVGVAPRAIVVPMAVNTYGELATQLNRIDTDLLAVDVINISLGKEVHSYDIFFSSLAYQEEVLLEILSMFFGANSPAQFAYKLGSVDLNLLKGIGRLVLRKKTIAVASGGNDGVGYDWDIANDKLINFPSSIPFVISAGAYEHNASGLPVRAHFVDVKDKSGNKFGSSNYGDVISIWAPGKNLWTKGYNGSGDPLWKYTEGTSMAAPQVAGVVALIKSVNKDLIYSDILDILRNQQNTASHSSFFPPNSATSSVFILNALTAMQDPRVGAKLARKYCLQYTFFGGPGSSIKGFSDVNDDIPGSGPVNPNLKGKALAAAMPEIQIGDTLEVLGWSQTERPNSMAPNDLEVIQATRLSTNTCRRAEFRISAAPPDNAPSDVQVWLLQGTQGKKVYPNEYIGIGIDGQDLQGIQIFIDGRLQPIKHLANNYVAFGLVPEVTPGVKDVIIQLAGGGSLTLEQALEVISLPHLQEIQSIPTTGATAMKAFDIGSETFMAVTNFYNQNPNAYNLYVDLFRWNGNQFTASQRIPAHGPYDIETFTINGEHYLAVAEYYHSQNHTFDFPSRIYKWNGSQFALFQSVPTHGASAWKHFTIGPDHYLMVANTATGTGGNVVNVNTQSELFKWNGTQFVSIQSIPTTAARDWEHLQVGEEHFLAVANEYNGSSYASSTNIFSEIYRWNGSQFTLLQRVHSEGARDWEAFSIGDRHFLALANLWGSTNSPSTAEKSKIYEWNGSAFVVAQTFEGLEAYALSWEHFTVND